ncbi:hypothetical protein PROFUN_05103 [Planoprotostelium fungivorum]|uniref:EF-hand domain-containing protein n=1 Tax=Planoprotostelium fungivorum TaxID=1890364 RepID=A0A2P6NRN7_9EUKA|nr:hypothetical protein PROFUN_05103 [Planoprotostelium fungivorum]
MGNAKSSPTQPQQETRWVDLYGSKVKQLPADLFVNGTPETSRRGTTQMAPKAQVEGLCLSHNPFALNDDLSRLNHLQYLDLSHCNLLTLHKSITSLTELRELNIQRNSISVLPVLPSSLEKFDASHNMILQLSEQISTLPKLYFLNLDGNPCAKRAKSITLRGRAKTGKMNGKEVTLEKLRFNVEELDALYKVYEDLVNPADGLIPSTSLVQRMGLSMVGDTTFVDSLFRVLERYGSRDELDVRAFLLGLGVIFKGTVEEKMTFCFHLYDLNYDGYVELQDILDVTKSAIISSVHIANFYRNDFTKQSGRAGQSSEFTFGVKTSQTSKSSTTVNVALGDPNYASETVVLSQWPYLKEVVTKRFKGMDRHGKGRVNLQEFIRGNFNRFPEVNQFLIFYGSILSYGPTLKL